jgi:hypothetical protein
MGPAIDSRIKPQDAISPMLHTKFEVKTTKNNSLVECCYESRFIDANSKSQIS